MSTDLLSGLLILGNLFFIAITAVIAFAVMLPTKRAGRPFRRAQAVALGFAVLAMVLAGWNAVITFGS